MRNKLFGGIMVLCIGVCLFQLQGSFTVLHILALIASILLFLPEPKKGKGKPVCIGFVILWALTLVLDAKLIYDRCAAGFVSEAVNDAEFYALCGALPTAEIVHTPGKGVLTVLLVYLRRLVQGKALNTAAMIVNAGMLKSAQLLLFLRVYRRHKAEPLTLLRCGLVMLFILQPEPWLTTISCESIAVSLVCFALYLAERNNEGDGAASSGLLGLAAALRGTALLALPRLVKKNGLKAATLILAAMLLCLAVPGVLLFTSSHSLYFTSELLPPTHYIMAGLADYDEAAEIEVTTSVSGLAERMRLNLAECVRRIDRMGLDGLLKHLLSDKLCGLWCNDVAWTGELLLNVGIFSGLRQAAQLDSLLWLVLLTGVCVMSFKGKGGGTLLAATLFYLVWNMSGAVMLMLVPYIVLTVSGDE